MLNAVNNYNSLGKLGPHYERPEYRPPSAGPEERPADRKTADLFRNGRPLEPRAAENKTAAPPAARLNAASARRLVETLAGQISALPPLSSDREPHAWLRTNLLPPIYV